MGRDTLQLRKLFVTNIDYAAANFLEHLTETILSNTPHLALCQREWCNVDVRVSCTYWQGCKQHTLAQ